MTIGLGHYLTVAAVLFGTALWTSPAVSQDSFPDRPLRLVVPYPPGGSTDLVGRLVAARMAEGLGRPVVVENKPGAAGAIGSAEVARAAEVVHHVPTGVGTQGVRTTRKRALPLIMC